MKKQQKRSKMDMITIREMISPELNLIKTADTMGGVFIHLASLFSKIQTLPTANRIIALAEAELAEEDRFAFENLEKAVAWFHEKIKILLPHVEWKPNSYEMANVNALLNYKALSLQASGYIGSLHFELRHLFIEVGRKEKNHPVFENCTRIEENTGLRIFDWPEYVDRALNSTPTEQQIYQWKEKADTHLPCLLRFLKILTLYNTYQPLILESRPDPNTLPKNLRELEERQCQAHIGFYLSAFKSHDSKKHPLSKKELTTLIDRFLYMLEQKIESYSPKKSSDCTTQINININQFLYFAANIYRAEAKEEDCNDNLNPNKSNLASPVSGKEKINKPKSEHWRTEQYKQDVNTLIPFAKKLWIKHIPKYKFPMNLGRETLADELLKNLPSYISLNAKGDKLRPRAKKALEKTDPRLWEKGKYMGLKPHWEKFDWIQT